MARETVEKVIDGIKYTFGRHTPKKSRKLFNRIIKIIGPSLTAAIEKESVNKLIREGLDAKLSDINIDIGNACKVLFDYAEESELDEIFDILLNEVIHNGDGTQKGIGNCRDNYNAIFMDTGIAHVYKVIYMAMEVEYQNFFGKGASLGAMKEKIKDLIPEKSQSIGSSGGR